MEWILYCTGLIPFNKYWYCLIWYCNPWSECNIKFVLSGILLNIFSDISTTFVNIGCLDKIKLIYSPLNKSTNEDELNNLFKVVKDAPLELIVYSTAFYGLRRSEFLGIRWSAIYFEDKTITISHKVITVADEKK